MFTSACLRSGFFPEMSQEITGTMHKVIFEQVLCHAIVASGSEQHIFSHTGKYDVTISLGRITCAEERFSGKLTVTIETDSQTQGRLS